MSILGSLKRLIFGVNIDSLEQAHTNESPHAVKINEADVNTEFFSASRNLLKEATTLKREKKFFEACEKLREAYSADGAENLMIEDRLRLPMYLQLAGKNDEGWDELNRLNVRYVDQFSQPRIANQRRVFLQKESNQKATNPVRSILRGENTPMPLSLALERTSVKMGELQNAPMPSWMADVIRGYEFSATLQLRIPLRVLLRHGELYLKNDGLQPQIAREPWEGMWLPARKTYEEIACGPDSTADSIAFFRCLDAEFAPAGRKAASDVGPVLVNDYLPFLIAVRRIVEGKGNIEEREATLRNELSQPKWCDFCDKVGGVGAISGRFFPSFLSTICGLSHAVIWAMGDAGLRTPEKINHTSDADLLAIKGIGNTKLKFIRAACLNAQQPSSELVDNVVR